jgi:hypothetical protein
MDCLAEPVIERERSRDPLARNDVTEGALPFAGGND